MPTPSGRETAQEKRDRQAAKARAEREANARAWRNANPDVAEAQAVAILAELDAAEPTPSGYRSTRGFDAATWASEDERDAVSQAITELTDARPDAAGYYVMHSRSLSLLSRDDGPKPFGLSAAFSPS